jgi:two-component system response regulator MprA
MSGRVASIAGLDRPCFERVVNRRVATLNLLVGPKVLIVEGDPRVRDVLCRGLADQGFEVEACAAGSEFLERVAHAAADVFVIDIGLPDSDGRDLCQALRAHGVQTPVLFLTGRDAVVDRVAGFDAGGDDCVSKPFHILELAVRLQALVRRAGGEITVEACGVRLEPLSHAVCSDGVEVLLTPTEFRILARLFARPGEVVRRRELVRAGWPYGAFVGENTLHVYVARLRRKLRALEPAPQIVNVHSVGYRVQYASSRSAGGRRAAPTTNRAATAARNRSAEPEVIFPVRTGEPS